MLNNGPRALLAGLVLAPFLAAAGIVELARLFAPYGVLGLFAAYVAGTLGASLLFRRVCRAPWPWVAMVVIMPAVGFALLALEMTSAVMMAASAGLLAVLLGGLRDRAPLFLSRRQVIERLRQLAEAHREGDFVDLGCGDGRVVHALARTNPSRRFVGVERSPVLALIAWLRCRNLSNVRISCGDLFKMDLSDVGVAYAFLSPAPMRRLHAKALSELRPHALLVSNSFAAAIPPDWTIDVGAFEQKYLLVWRKQNHPIQTGNNGAAGEAGITCS